MLRRTNISAGLQSSETKCWNADRRLPAKFGYQPDRSGSNLSSKVPGLLTRGSHGKLDRETWGPPSIDRVSDVPRTSKGEFKNDSARWKRYGNEQSSRMQLDVPSSVPYNEETRGKRIMLSAPSNKERGVKDFVWSTTGIIDYRCLGSLEVRETDEAIVFDNVEACLSKSISLVPQLEHGSSTFTCTYAIAVVQKTMNSDREALVDSDVKETVQKDAETRTLHKIWKKKKEIRRLGTLILLNGLAALYGSSNVANRFVADAAPTLPASLTAMVRFSSALLLFIPALTNALRNRDLALLRAGAELGGLAFAATFVDSLNPAGSSSSSPSLLFAFTVIFVPLMEFLVGRQAKPKFTRFATLAAAILGMGLLEEEGFGWKGISCPQVSDLWGLAVSAISGLHIFRSEAHGSRFDPLRLNAVQCGVLAILGLGWELCSTFDARELQSHANLEQLQALPWAPLIYNGLICCGLCSWLEIRGLRSVQASTATLVYTTIPVWGAFLSCFTNSDVPPESALIGGMVIVATSIYAQFITKDDDLQFQPKKSTMACEAKGAKDMPSASKNLLSRKSVEIEQVIEKVEAHPDYFPGALITSQLKFPFYAAQAKRLLTEAKLKLGALKSMGVLFTGASNSNLFPGPGSPSALPNSTSGAPASGTPTGPNNLTGTAAHVSTLHASSTVHIGHGPQLLPSQGPDIMTSAAVSTAHGVDSAMLMSSLTHTLTAILTGLESGFVIVGSDIMMALSEAADIATLLERFLQVGAESVVYAVAKLLTNAAGSGNMTTDLEESAQRVQEASNYVGSTPQIQQTLDGHVAIVSKIPVDPSHLDNAWLDSITHLIQPILSNFQM